MVEKLKLLESIMDIDDNEKVKLSFIDLVQSFDKFIDKFLPYYSENVKNDLTMISEKLDSISVESTPNSLMVSVVNELKEVLEMDYELKIDDTRQKFYKTIPPNLSLSEKEVLDHINNFLGVIE